MEIDLSKIDLAQRKLLREIRDIDVCGSLDGYIEDQVVNGGHESYEDALEALEDILTSMIYSVINTMEVK